MIPSKEENPTGLHRRYNVTKADGSPTDPGAVYFVLRLDGGGGDPAHIMACREAAIAYARNAPDYLKQMADELRAYVKSQKPIYELCPDCDCIRGRCICDNCRTGKEDLAEAERQKANAEIDAYNADVKRGKQFGPFAPPIPPGPPPVS